MSTQAHCTIAPFDVRFLADRTVTQYDRLLVTIGRSVRLSVCNAVYCGSQGRCTHYRTKSCTSVTSVFPAGKFLFVRPDAFVARCIV